MARHKLHLIPQDIRKTMQLAENIPLAVGYHCEISVNIVVSDGTSDVLEKIQLTSAYHFASSLVWIRFDDANVGSQTRTENHALYSPAIDITWTPDSSTNLQTVSSWQKSYFTSYEKAILCQAISC